MISRTSIRLSLLERISAGLTAHRAAYRSFYEFVQEMWDTVVPEEAVWNWHMEVICDEVQKVLERVIRGEPKLYDLVINVPPGSSKPVWDEEHVLMANGSYKRLKDVVRGDYVIGRSGRACRVVEVHEQGLLQCSRISTFCGRTLVAAPDHPVLTTSGWKNVSQIVPDDVLALMHTADVYPTTKRTADDFKLAGYFIGDGSATSNNCNITSVNPDYIEDVCATFARLGFDHSIAVSKNGVTRISGKAKPADGSENGKHKGRGRGYRPPRGPRKWLREPDIDIAGKNSHTKEVPPFVWRGSNDQIREFLAAYFHCDGSVSYKDSGKRMVVVGMSTVSEKLAFGIQRLLLRLGVSMRVRKRVAKSGFGYNRDLAGYTYYCVETTDQDVVARFLEQVPIRGYKRERLEQFVPIKRTFAQAYWPDRVRSVEPAGRLPCRCLTVDDDASFVVNDIVVHNSTICSVMAPAWLWLRMPTARTICGSYSHPLALELSRKCRDIIQSEKFQEMSGHLRLKDDQNTKGYYVNTRGGSRFTTSTGGTVTGFHAHAIFVDDPLNPLAATSDAEVHTSNYWIGNTLATRKIDKRVTPMILIMQRLHQDDPSGHMLEHAKGKVRHICLPAEIDASNAGSVKPRALKKRYTVDPDKPEAKLLDPIRMPRSVLEEFGQENQLGEYGYSGQMLQNPVPPGGGMFKVERLRILDVRPTDNHFTRKIRFWDKAGTEGGGAYTVGVLIGEHREGGWVILDVIRVQYDTGAREKLIRLTAQMDGTDVEIGIEQEPGSGGKESAENTILSLAGYICEAIRPSGDKTMRAMPFSAQVNSGNVSLVKGDWNAEYVKELGYFPKSKFKDQVDASSGAFTMLTQTGGRIEVIR